MANLIRLFLGLLVITGSWQTVAAETPMAQKFRPDVASRILDSIEFQFAIANFRGQGWLEESIRQVNRQRTDILQCITARERELASVNQVMGKEFIEQVLGKENRSPEESTVANQVESLRSAVTECKLLLEKSNQLVERLTQLEAEFKREQLNQREPTILHNASRGFSGMATYHRARFDDIREIATDPDVLARAQVVLALLLAGFGFGFLVNRRARMPAATSSRSPSSQVAAGFSYLAMKRAPLLFPIVLLLGYLWFSQGSALMHSAYGQILLLLLGYLLALILVRILVRRVRFVDSGNARQRTPARGLYIRLVIAVTLLGIWLLEVVILHTDVAHRSSQLFLQNVLATLIIVSLLELTVFLGRFQFLPRLGNVIRLVSVGLLALCLILEWIGFRTMSRFIWGGLAMTGVVLLGYYLLEHLLRDFYDGLDSGKKTWQIRFRRFFAVAEDEPVPGLIWFRLLSVGFLWMALIILLLKAWGAPDSTIVSLASFARDGVQVGESLIVPSNVLLGILILALLLMLFRWFRDNLDRKYLSRSRMDSGAREALVTITGYVGFVIACLVGLSIAGVSFDNLAIVAGALSLGIGFGLQNIVNNFVSGIILLFERPIRTGDWIVTGNTEGFVKKISVRSTEVQTFDRSDVIVPNSELISTQVTNWTLRDKHGRVIVPVGVAYGSDTELVKRLLEEAANEIPEVIKNRPLLPIKVFFRSFGDSALDFELRCYIFDILYVLDVKSRLHFAIDRKFREHNIEISFPQRDIHIRTGNALNSLIGTPD